MSKVSNTQHTYAVGYTILCLDFDIYQDHKKSITLCHLLQVGHAHK
jgi:hypothetical protein